jgi:hypothetical protein
MVAGVSVAAAQHNPSSKPGFPVTIPGGGYIHANQVAGQVLVTDLKLSADGTKSIVWGTTISATSGLLHVLYKNSAGNWVEPYKFPIDVGFPMDSSPAVADLDGDGMPDIVIGLGSNSPASSGGGVIAIKNRGATTQWTPLWQVSTSQPVVSTPAIGDINGDGQVDVVFGGWDMYIHAVNGLTGVELSIPTRPGHAAGGWPIFVRDTVWSSPVLHDIDGDGILDVIIGSDAHAEPSPYNTPAGGCLHVLRWDTLQAHEPWNLPGTPDSNPIDWASPTELPGFPKCIDQVIFSSPAVGDIDGDGKPEIVHGTGTFYTNRNERVYAWHCDGSPAWGTVANPGIAISGQVSTSPALADLDGDGIPEAIFTADNTRSSTTFHLYAFKGDGTAVFPAQQVLDCNDVSNSAFNPIVADVLGTTGTDPEILVPTNTSIAVFSKTGAIQSNTTSCLGSNTYYSPTTVPGVAVAQLDGAPDNQIEMVVVSAKASSTPGVYDSFVNVWNPVTRTSDNAPTPAWGLFHQNDRRTGDVPGTATCRGTCSVSTASSRLNTLAPCRVVDTRNATGPLGGPALSANAVRDFVMWGHCGVPSSATAVSINVTITQPSAAGSVRFSPGCAPLGVSAISYGAGQTRANNAVLGLGPNGELTANAVQASGTVQLIIDINGYFQ